MVGDVPRARRMHRHALRLWRRGRHSAAHDRATISLRLLRTQGRCGHGTAFDQVAVLLTLADFTGQLAGHAPAGGLIQQAVALLRVAPPGGERDRWLTDALLGLGNAQRRDARYLVAEATLAEALALADLADLEPQRRAACHNALGVLAKDTGRYQQAQAHYVDALAILERSVGSDSPDLANLYHNFAGLSYAQGDYAKAEPFARRALELRRRVRAPDLQAIAADTGVLGSILAGRGRHDEAERLLRDASQTWTSRFGPGHYEVAVNLHNLAYVHHARGDHRSAETSLQAALQIKTRLLRNDHPEIMDLGTTLRALRQEQGGLSHSHSQEHIDRRSASTRTEVTWPTTSFDGFGRLAVTTTLCFVGIGPQPQRQPKA